MGDNLDLPDRNGLRTPMQWDTGPNAGFSTGKPVAELVHGNLGPANVNVTAQIADPGSLLHAIRRMIAVRKQHHVLGRGALVWLVPANPSVTAYLRREADRSVLVLDNLSGSPQAIRIPSDHQGSYADLLSGANWAIHEATSLPPYAYLWLQRRE
jgi:maltose alpha-D-glucosyltransferase/alpha-amylase